MSKGGGAGGLNLLKSREKGNLPSSQFFFPFTVILSSDSVEFKCLILRPYLEEGGFRAHQAPSFLRDAIT